MLKKRMTIGFLACAVLFSACAGAGAPKQESQVSRETQETEESKADENTQADENTSAEEAEASSEAGAQEGTGSYTFTDSEGAEVTLDGTPSKVAVLFSSYAEIWNLAGGTTAVSVQESVERGFVPEGTVTVDAAGGHSTINLEALVAEEPDFVVGTAEYESQLEAVAFCREKGIPAAVFRVEDFSDYLKVLRIFCDITGNDAAYEENGTAVKEQIDELFSGLPEEAPGKYLLVRAGSSAKYTKAKKTDEHFVCRMLRDLHAENIADTDTQISGELSLERILQDAPEYLFITTMGDAAEAKSYMDSLLESDGWKDLDCVKAGQVYYLPKELFHYKPNARWFEAYQYLSDILYSEPQD